MGKAIIKSAGKLTYDEVDAVIRGDSGVKLQGATVKDVQTLKVSREFVYALSKTCANRIQTIAQKFREVRYGSHSENIPSLRLLYQLDDENVPVEHNIFDSTPAHEIIEELSYKANYFVAQKIAAALPEKAFLRRHAIPKAGRLQTFAERMTRIGYEIDTSSSGSLQNSLFKVKDAEMRKVCLCMFCF